MSDEEIAVGALRRRPRVRGGFASQDRLDVFTTTPPATTWQLHAGQQAVAQLGLSAVQALA